MANRFSVELKRSSAESASDASIETELVSRYATAFSITSAIETASDANAARRINGPCVRSATVVSAADDPLTETAAPYATAMPAHRGGRPAGRAAGTAG